MILIELAALVVFVAIGVVARWVGLMLFEPTAVSILLWIYGVGIAVFLLSFGLAGRLRG